MVNNKQRNDEVLLVEDNATDAELTIREFKKHNLANNLAWVKDGAEALDFLFARGKYADRNIHSKPKIILLDLRLPKVDGLEVLTKIKSDPRTREIPVVVLTSSKEDKDIKESYKLGANSFIVKPVNFDSFSEVVTQIGLYWLLINEPPQ
jgi:two-component system, response regulator